MIIESYPLTVLSTLLTLIVYFFTILKVGHARGKYDVPAPGTDGPPEFARINRVQQNTSEQLILFFPSFWIFASLWGDIPAAVLGIIFIIGRILYMNGYYKAAEKRSRGFGIASLSIIFLLLGSIVGIISSIF